MEIVIRTLALPSDGASRVTMNLSLGDRQAGLVHGVGYAGSQLAAGLGSTDGILVAVGRDKALLTATVGVAAMMQWANMINLASLSRHQPSVFVPFTEPIDVYGDLYFVCLGVGLGEAVQLRCEVHYEKQAIGRGAKAESRIRIRGTGVGR